MSSTVNGHPCNLLEKEWNQTLLSGSDSSSGARATLQDSSIMKFPNQLFGDTVVILTTLRRTFTHSIMLTKNQSSCLESIPPLLKEERSLRKSGKLLANWCQSCYPRMILSTLMSMRGTFLMSLISEEFGSITENICSS
jgi:hypothetical protein